MEQLGSKPANSCPLTPLGFLDRAATAYANSPSVVYNDKTYTWSETYRRCLQLASSLSSVGVERGHVVSVIAPNIPAMYELHFAVPMSGAVLNTVNTRLDARTISVLLRHSESKLVFVDYQFCSLVLEALSLFPRSTETPKLVLIEEDGLSMTPTVDFIDTYEGMVGNGDPNFKWVRPKSEWDPMVLNYTSGTTSSPKGVVHCHRGLFIITVGSLIDWGIPSQPVFLWTLPMFHANGWSYSWGMAAVGGTNICLRKIHVSTIYSLIRQHGVTHICGAPAVLNMLSNSPDAKPLDKPVKILTSGAPPSPPVLLRTESLGFTVSHSYGLTEAAGFVVSCAWKPDWNSLPDTERARLKARQGVRTIALSEMDVVDPATGMSVKHDGSSTGEIVFRGGSIMLGYLKNPEATSSSIRENGWFYTGDIGVIHSDGYVELKDRSKDVIISGGENINSTEVETVLYMHPAVNEAAVVARQDKFWGETPCAFVRLKEEFCRKPTGEEMIEFCRDRLPHYMAPKTVIFRDEIPKTSTGKIQKFVLREIVNAMD
ncbi:AMP-dependent synthetase/ligase [Melia azedarach]|uniref:AMP-dependent synthetase/ligase n=1 Tax=Melia azedarach TaxID=155640 RepID=A0ACC1WNS4_MELAZ|nr:AMP-dependent synthetase/ligase [Melia azedarach]